MNPVLVGNFPVQHPLTTVRARVVCALNLCFLITYPVFLIVNMSHPEPVSLLSRSKRAVCSCRVKWKERSAAWSSCGIAAFRSGRSRDGPSGGGVFSARANKIVLIYTTRRVLARPEEEKGQGKGTRTRTRHRKGKGVEGIQDAATIAKAKTQSNADVDGDQKTDCVCVSV